MKKIVDRKKHAQLFGLSSPYWVFTLECGHQIRRGGFQNGGFSAYMKGQGQQKAKCYECEGQPSANGAAI